MYHIIAFPTDESSLTQDDTTAEMAEMEGAAVIFNAGLEEICEEFDIEGTPEQLAALCL